MMHIKMRFGIVMTLILVSTQALAWRETGHFVVCELGYSFASAKTKAKIDRILNGKSFAEQCTWPDMVRYSPEWKHTYGWHFVNIADNKNYFTDSFDDRGDAVRALIKAERSFENPNQSGLQKIYNLRFIGHFTGDIHQPLHAGKLEDFGGNKIGVGFLGRSKFISREIIRLEAAQGECQKKGGRIENHTGECVELREKEKGINLHKIWDLQLLEEFIAQNRLDQKRITNDSQYFHKAYAKHIAAQKFPPEQVRAWRYSTIDKWVEGSYARRSLSYKHITGKPIVDGDELMLDYYSSRILTVNKRLLMAGHRLSATLDRIFDDKGYHARKRAFFRLSAKEILDRIVDAGGKPL